MSQAAEILRIFAVGMMANTAIVDRTDGQLVEAIKKLIALLIEGAPATKVAGRSIATRR
jgi:hypothetical protein